MILNEFVPGRRAGPCSISSVDRKVVREMVSGQELVPAQEHQPAGLVATIVHVRTRLLLAGAVGLLLILVAAGLYAMLFGINPKDLAALGYPGVFLVMVLSGCSIFFPAPGQAAVLAGGALWNPLLVGLAAGLGNAVGELTGYVAGQTGGALLGNRRFPSWCARFRAWLGRYGFVAILLLAMIPNPVFDAVGLLAGSLGYSLRRFWIACAIGNTIKYAGLAQLGEMTRWFVG